MRLLLDNFIQVIEYSVARQVMMGLGMSLHRKDADNLIVYADSKRREDNDPMGTLYVDEGTYSDSIIRKDDFDTKIGLILAHYECVDATTFLSLLVKKLIPNVEIKPTQAIGRGYRQQHFLEQYVALLAQWSRENPKSYVSFVHRKDL